MSVPAEQVRRLALPLEDDSDLDPLLNRIGDARFVLLGEASHGTHEFYTWRAAITRRLVTEKGFRVVAVEGDWPDCYRVHCAITQAPGAPADPAEALVEFDRWPTWMWANQEVVAFARWLRDHNAGLPTEQRVGFYGLDVYSLWDSLRSIVDYLGEHEPEHVEAALSAIRCLEPYAEDPQAYARATRLAPTSCEHRVIEMLTDLRGLTRSDWAAERDVKFNAEQNALVAAGAEAYYRAMVKGGSESWNVRDCHMADTLDRLVAHHGSTADGTSRDPGSAPHETPAKAVVWEHNTHIGDARFTDMAGAGMVNLGQLARERHGEDDVVLVGFGTYRGTVIAGSGWGEPMQVKEVPPARPGSVEALLHDTVESPSALMVFSGALPKWLTQRRDHRAIGVVYRPEVERWGNYVPSVLGRRYDAFCWFDRSRALSPLHDVHPSGQEWETWPYGG